MSTKSIPRLKNLYKTELVSQLQSDLKLKNINQTPRLAKIVVNVGLGRSSDDKRMFEVATNTLRKVTGQNPVRTKARMSIAGFNLREGQDIGLMVTLRGDNMYEFFDRLVTIVLPRLRDFHGVSNRSFDQQGNYSIGIKDQSVFPELSFEETTQLHGLQVTIQTTADDQTAAKALLEKLGMPFMKERK